MSDGVVAAAPGAFVVVDCAGVGVGAGVGVAAGFGRDVLVGVEVGCFLKRPDCAERVWAKALTVRAMSAL